MKILIRLAKVLFNFIYLFVKLLPMRHKVVMLSRQSDNPSLDFRLLEAQLKAQDPTLTVVLLCKRIGPRQLDKIKYVFYMLHCMVHLATSRVAVIDGYVIPISMLNHKKKLRIIQMWHALGAIKRFGYQALGASEGRSRKLAVSMNMHEKYDYIICASQATKIFYQEAFNTPADKIIVKGMPRVDYLQADSAGLHAQFLADYPGYHNEKKTILYIPTFRSSVVKGVKNMAKRFGTGDYNLIIRPHVLTEVDVDARYTVDAKYNTFDLMKFSDYIVTDYSAASIEASVLAKPIFFYIFDVDGYKNNRGLNVDLNREVGDFVVFNTISIQEKIENQDYNMEHMMQFRDKYVETCGQNNTAGIASFILELMIGEKGLS